MLYTGISPVHKFYSGMWVKREDLAYWSSLDYPSGSKVRQYLDMAHSAVEKGEFPPCVVGCSANSAMQIYVSATAKQLKTKGIIYTARRKVKSDATKYAESLGAEVNEIKPGYLSNIRKHARQCVIDLKNVVIWDRHKAISDTVAQCVNIPEGIKRVIVPTGSGLTAAGVLIGTKEIEVVAVCTSPMADKTTIMRFVHMVGKNLGSFPDSRLSVIPPLTPYDIPLVDRLPDGTPLDPFYAAKAYGYMQEGDLLWPPGLRPVCSMPVICQNAFKDWKGPK